MLSRTVTALLTAALAGSVAAAPAQATEPGSTEEPTTAPAVTGITTENTGGGFSPYLPLYSSVVVTFTDETPSAKSAYRVKVPGVKAGKFWLDKTETPGTFVATGPAYGLAVGEESLFRVVELADGEVTGTSEPASFTFTYVDHPDYLSTSSKKVDGVWSYRAGTRAKLEFRGAWEPGTVVSTRVWVSRTKTFTDRDWSFNVRKDGALVDKDVFVSSFRVPRKHIGKFVWVSVRGWKAGEGGWAFEIPAEKIIRRG